MFEFKCPYCKTILEDSFRKDKDLICPDCQGDISINCVNKTYEYDPDATFLDITCPRCDEDIQITSKNGKRFDCEECGLEFETSNGKAYYHENDLQVITDDQKDKALGFLEIFKPQAAAYLADSSQLKDLLSTAVKKANKMIGKHLCDSANELWVDLKTFFRIIAAYISGEYQEIPWKSLLRIVLAVVYFVVPVDAIPDFIPFVGYIDCRVPPLIRT